MKNIQITFAGYGHFTISTTFRGKEYKTVTTNTQAIDRYRDTDKADHTRGELGMTRNQSATTLYNEIKRANGLR